MKKVSIVIPCWNSEKLLKMNFDYVIEASKNKINNILEIIVVDDASTDESIAFLENKYKKEIRLVKLNKNRGFSGAVNAGVNQAKGELVCLLNTDVAPSSNFLKNVFSHFDNDKMFAVSLHERDYGGVSASFEEGFLDFKPLAEKDKAYRTFWVSGGSGVFRKEYWRELKGMDEDLFSPFYWEDIDICYRAQKRGYICMWEPEARVLHNHESVINESNFKKKYISLIKERNELLFYWKNIHSKKMFKRHLKWLAKRSLSSPGYLRVIKRGLEEFSQVRKMRSFEKKKSKVSDEVIFAGFSE